MQDLKPSDDRPSQRPLLQPETNPTSLQRMERRQLASLLPLATQVIAVNSGMKTIIYALPFELRMCFEKAIIANVLLWGSKSWAIQSKKIQALRVFQFRCLQSTLKINVMHKISGSLLSANIRSLQTLLCDTLLLPDDTKEFSLCEFLGYSM